MNQIAVATMFMMPRGDVRSHARGQVHVDAHADSAARSSSPYEAIVAAFPADVAVEIDHAVGVVSFRIAGNRVSVMSEVDRISALVASRGAMVRFLGPIRWGGLWDVIHVVHGEMRLLP
jgi:hypothetical protein